MNDFKNTTIACNIEQYHEKVFPILLKLGYLPDNIAINNFQEAHFGVHVFGDGGFTLVHQPFHETQIEFQKFVERANILMLEQAKQTLQMYPITTLDLLPLKWVGDKLYVGKVKVGNVFQTVFVAKGDKKNIQASCFLPSVKNNLGRFETEKEAREKVEKAIKVFFSLLLKELPEEQQD